MVGVKAATLEASGGSDSDLRAPTLGKVGTLLATQGPLGSGWWLFLALRN